MPPKRNLVNRDIKQFLGSTKIKRVKLDRELPSPARKLGSLLEKTPVTAVTVTVADDCVDHGSAAVDDLALDATAPEVLVGDEENLAAIGNNMIKDAVNVSDIKITSSSAAAVNEKTMIARVGKKAASSRDPVVDRPLLQERRPKALLSETMKKEAAWKAKLLTNKREKSPEEEGPKSLFPVDHEPAHLRFKNLLNTGRLASSISKASKSVASSASAAAVIAPFTMPTHFENLLKIFVAMESMYMFSSNRGESFIFHKQRKAMENMCRKSISVLHLQQILGVYPESYKHESIWMQWDGVMTESFVLEWKSFDKNDDQDVADDARFAMDGPNEHECLCRRKMVFQDRLKKIYHDREKRSDGGLDEMELPLLQISTLHDPTKNAKAEPTKQENSPASDDDTKEDKKPLSLLERIRLKEKLKKDNEPMAAIRKQRNEVSTWEVMIDSLIILYVSRGKSSLLFSEVVDHLSRNRLVGLGPEECKVELARLEEKLKPHLAFHTICEGKVRVVRFDRKVPSKQLKQLLLNQ